MFLNPKNLCRKSVKVEEGGGEEEEEEFFGERRQRETAERVREQISQACEGERGAEEGEEEEGGSALKKQQQKKTIRGEIRVS